MPVYNTLPPIRTKAATTYTVWNAESPTPGNGTTAASQQVQLCKNSTSITPFSVDGKFSGAPGAFEVDVQVAAFDVDAQYQTISGGNVTTVDAINFTFHVDATLTNSTFARLLMRTRTNAVSITASISQ
jgi:hypothetical protein